MENRAAREEAALTVATCFICSIINDFIGICRVRSRPRPRLQKADGTREPLQLGKLRTQERMETNRIKLVDYYNLLNKYEFNKREKTHFVKQLSLFSPYSEETRTWTPKKLAS